MSAWFKRLSDPLRDRTAARRADRARVFAAAQARWPALTPFSDDTAAVAFARDAHNGIAERDAVARAFIAAHQAEPTGPWSIALFAIFHKNLTFQASRFVGTERDIDEIHQLICAKFLEVIGQLDVSSPRVMVFFRVPRDTGALVSKELRRRRLYWERNPARVVYDPDWAALEPQGPVIDAATVEAPTDEPPEGRELARLARLFEVLAEHLPAADVALLRTCVGDDSLRDLINSNQAQSDADRDRAYQRAKRQRTRLIERIHWVLLEHDLAEALGPEQAVPWLGIA